MNARPGLAASAAVALAYGVVLPVLPTVVPSSPSPARTMAELMAVYSAAMVVTAPIWVRACRHLPAHRIVGLSLLGQAAAIRAPRRRWWWSRRCRCADRSRRRPVASCVVTQLLARVAFVEGSTRERRGNGMVESE